MHIFLLTLDLDPAPQATRQKASPSLTMRFICWSFQADFEFCRSCNPARRRSWNLSLVWRCPFFVGSTGGKVICVTICWPRWCSQQLRRDPSLATRTCTVIESSQEEDQLDLSWSICAYFASIVPHHSSFPCFCLGRNRRGCQYMILNTFLGCAAILKPLIGQLDLLTRLSVCISPVETDASMNAGWDAPLVARLHHRPWGTFCITYHHFALLASPCWVELSGRPRGRIIYGGSSGDYGKDTRLTGCRSSSSNVDAAQCMCMNELSKIEDIECDDQLATTKNCMFWKSFFAGWHPFSQMYLYN